MTSSTAPGWYVDPQAPAQMRWWDGTAWTSDVYERVAPPGGFLDETPQAAAPAQQMLVAAAPATTEDGVPLASWRRRVAARLIDSLIITPVGLLVCAPVVIDLVRHLVDVARAQESSATVDPLAIYDAQTLRALGVITLVSLVVGLVYEVAFLLWRAATPGKLLLGLRVRRWTPGEPLGPNVVARRWLAYQGVSQIPTFGGLYTIVDVLWPLWDPRRQALHDKFAGTCVVRPAQRP